MHQFVIDDQDHCQMNEIHAEQRDYASRCPWKRKNTTAYLEGPDSLPIEPHANGTHFVSLPTCDLTWPFITKKSSSPLAMVTSSLHSRLEPDAFLYKKLELSRYFMTSFWLKNYIFSSDGYYTCHIF